jgi:hypothetical protein
MSTEPHEREAITMEAKTARKLGPNGQDADRPNRRLTERVPADVGLIYSGMDEGQVVMGDGTVRNLSEQGIGIQGKQVVKPGMDLALFLNLPASEEPLCIAQCRVSWVSGNRFGVLVTSSAEDAQQELRRHVWDHKARSEKNSNYRPK